MYGCGSWTIKKTECQRMDAFEWWSWRRLLRVPWTARRSNQSILKEISPEFSLEGLILKLKVQYFGHLMWTDSLEKDPNAGKVWRQEEKTTQDHLVGWHHWFNGQVWVNSGSWWWTWRPDMLHSMGSQRVGHDWATELNRIAFFPLLPSSFSVVFISTLPQHSYFASSECQSPSSQFLMLNSSQ